MMTKKKHKKQLSGSIAVIDIGAHAGRLKIAQVDATGSPETLESLSYPIALGADVVRTGRISMEHVEETGRMLRDFSRVMAEYGVKRRRAVVSSSAAEAQNCDMFLHQVERISGVRLQALDGPEEIRLLVLAVRDALAGKVAWSKRNVMICSIGTGSSLLCLLRQGRLRTADTIRLGTLRIVEELGEVVSPTRLRETIDPFIAAMVTQIARLAVGERPEVLIAVGSSVQSLVAIRRGAREDEGLARLSRNGFRRLFQRVSGRAEADLVADFGVSDYQARNLDPCCHIIDHLFEITAANSLLVPFISTRDAIIRDLIREEQGAVDVFVDDVLSCAESLGEKYGYDSVHARTVTDAALSLFDALQPLHGLSVRDRLLLEVAGVVHEIGLFVSHRSHHKHSHYLLSNSELPGVSPREQDIVSLIARYHRRAMPKPTHPEYCALPVEDRIRVSKMAALLRVADAVDRSHSGRSQRVRANVVDGTLRISVRGPEELHLERWALERKADLFEDVFGLRVMLEGGPRR